MARNPKILKTQEEISKVPQDKEVHIEIEPDDQVTLSESELQLQKEHQEQQKEQKKEKARAEAAKKEQEAESSITAFKAQLEDMKKANELAKQQAEEAEKQRQEAVRLANEREEKLKELNGRAEQSEYDSVLNAMGAATAEAEAASRDIENAMAAQDGKALADAQRRLARAESRLVQYEDGKAAIEARREQEKQAALQPKTQEAKVQLSIDQQIDSWNLLPAEKAWLKAHPDVLVDARKNTRMQAAHLDAEDAGHIRGSESYFKFMNERLGYAKPDPVIDDVEDNDSIVSAPVSRDAPSAGTGRPLNNRITLTPEQREIARLSGISDIDYARQLLKLNEYKRNGHYRDQ